jgi:AraC family transcriptional regulator
VDFLTRDRVAESVMTRLELEARNGCPSGQAYAESACEFLAHRMLHVYSSRPTPHPRPAGGLPRRRLKMVLEYINESLAQPITLRQLAELAGVSAAPLRGGHFVKQ